MIGKNTHPQADIECTKVRRKKNKTKYNLELQYVTYPKVKH